MEEVEEKGVMRMMILRCCIKNNSHKLTVPFFYGGKEVFCYYCFINSGVTRREEINILIRMMTSYNYKFTVPFGVGRSVYSDCSINWDGPLSILSIPFIQEGVF